MTGQTWAIFVDAYRELNARKLFWIAMGLSALVVLAFAMIGVNAAGNVTFLTFETQIPVGTFGWGAADIYKLVFVQFGIKFWLAWLTTILALITTASIFPDFISSGSIDLVLSKPIGRWRLFFTKYATGLLFVTGQVLVFTLATFLVIGIRGGEWEPALFIAVPVVVLFYSYLFSVCVLLGLWTKSGMAALILTLLLWFVVFSMNATDAILVSQRESQKLEVQSIERSIERAETKQAAREASSNGGLFDAASNGIRAQSIEGLRERLENEQKTLDAFTKWTNRVVLAKTVLPKTGETIALLERWLIDLADLPDMATTNFDGDGRSRDSMQIEFDGDPETQPRVDDALAHVEDSSLEREGLDEDQLAAIAMRDRSVAWVAGTSILFEAFVLLFAGWIFSRRDF